MKLIEPKAESTISYGGLIEKIEIQQYVVLSFLLDTYVLLCATQPRQA